MGGGSEAVDWARALEALMERLAPRFKRPEPRRRALAYVRGLLADRSEPGFPRWPCRSPRPEANSCFRSMTCYDQPGESIAERWVKVGIRVFARIYKAFSRAALIHLGNPGFKCLKS